MKFLSFNSLYYISFVIVLLLLLKFQKKEKIRQIFILFFSVIFYFTWGWQSFIVLIGESIICFVWYKLRNYSFFKNMGSAYIVITLLIVLALFKYRIFIDDILFKGEGSTSFQGLDFQPIGISFFTFSMISFVVDVSRGSVEGDVKGTQLLLYILFFPKILQGPINNSASFIKELQKEHIICKEDVINGAQIFLFGLIKKIVVADRLALFVDTVYRTPKVFDSLSILVCIVAYTIHLYCDFSGYTDMAIGTSRMLGYDLASNFNLPFMSQSVSEYWRRWHMSLNEWFREYLFYPIVRAKWVNGFRKKCKGKLPKNIVNILPSAIGMVFVWPLIGLWHGASLNYVLHGSLYGLMMIIGLVYGALIKNRHEGKVFTVLRIIRTYLITVVMLTLFRSPDIDTFTTIFSRLFNCAGGIRYISVWALVYIPLVIGCNIFAYIKNGGNSYHPILDLTLFRNKVILLTAVILMVIFMYSGESYFMYFQF